MAGSAAAEADSLATAPCCYHRQQRRMPGAEQQGGEKRGQLHHRRVDRGDTWPGSLEVWPRRNASHGKALQEVQARPDYCVCA